MNMTLFDAVFYFLGFLTLGSAAIMVFSKNVIYSAVGLLFTFFGVAGIYVLLAADFLAVVQVLVYVGGILILLLFGVMLSNKITNIDITTETFHFLPASLVTLGVFIVLFRVFMTTDWNPVGSYDFEPTTRQIGTLMMTDYLIPFEIVSILLLGALIGAAYIARKD